MSTQASSNDSIATVKPAWRRLLACTGIMVLLYQMLVWCVPGLGDAEPSFCSQIFPWVKGVSQQDIENLQSQEGHHVRPVIFLAVCAALFAVYCHVLSLLKGRQTVHVERFVFCSGAVMMSLFLLAPVMLSSDLYAYVVYGRAVSVYHGNPYLQNPPVPSQDPFMPLFGAWIPSWYGPLWTWLCAGLTWLAGDNVGLTVLVFRLIAIVAMLATSGVVLAVLRRMCPERAAQGLALFLWNPLVLIETGLSGHNDGFMLFFLALAFWLHLRGWKVTAVLALTLSAMLKFVTGMLIPLYMIMVLREGTTWRARGLFAARAVALALIALIGERLVGHKETGSVTAQSAFSADFYQNNFHELLFNGLRRALGEDAESVALARSFQGWWVGTTGATSFREKESDGSMQLRQLSEHTPLFVLAPQHSEWLRVFDPASRQRGYVHEDATDVIERPALAENDAAIEDMEQMISERQTARTANVILRIVTWLLMAAFGLLAAWKAADFPRYITWSAAAMLAALFLIITEIRPWYLNWALLPAALAPSRMPARLAVMASLGALTLYFSLTYEGGEHTWLATWRSVPAFVVPLLIFAFMLQRKPAHAN